MSGIFFEALAGTQLYPLTDRRISGLSHTEQIARLAEAGAKIVQLREKELSSSDFYTEAASALLVARERGIKVIINDRVDIALAVKADGVHLGQDDLPPTAARKLLGPRAIIGISTHNPDQARVAATLPVDYIALGPIFGTNTKKSSNPTVGLEGIQHVREALTGVALIAIGGITVEQRDKVLAAGVDAVAVISDLWAPNGRLSLEIRSFIHPR